MGESAALLSARALRGGPALSTFVSVGNALQPFGRLLAAVDEFAPGLPQPVVVQHGNTPFASVRCTCRAFVSMDEFEHLAASAELLLLHAGAGAVIHAIRSGKVPVVMPRQRRYGEHLDDHQLELARALGGAGRIVVAMEPADLVDSASRALALQARGRLRVGEPAMLTLVRDTLNRYAC